jgi:hypothetical protein
MTKLESDRKAIEQALSGLETVKGLHTMGEGRQSRKPIRFGALQPS